jgi:hypothetical protein
MGRAGCDGPQVRMRARERRPTACSGCGLRKDGPEEEKGRLAERKGKGRKGLKLFLKTFSTFQTFKFKLFSKFKHLKPFFFKISKQFKNI